MSTEYTTACTQKNLLSFFQQLLPPRTTHARDALLYHGSTRAGLVPERSVEQMLLSITATEGIYERLTKHSMLFVHRPWELDRRRVPRGCLVVTSHFRFDEILTVGYNPVLARSLGCIEDSLAVLAGYKNDPARRIGSLGLLSMPQNVETLLDRVSTAFDLETVEHLEPGTSESVKAIALMNAFDAGTVDRVVEHFAQLPDDSIPASQVLYVTGQHRESGAERATALDIPVCFVGHRSAEVWGIRRLAHLLQEAFPGVKAEMSFEPEPEMPPKATT